MASSDSDHRKAAGGLCLAQDPETAEFPNMPQSLIQSGYADQAPRVEDMPAVLRRCAEQALGLAESAPELAPHGTKANQRELQLWDMLQILRARTGHDFSPFKTAMVLRRVQRRMGLLGTTALESYGTRLRESPAEVTALENDLMINVTGFFRDCDAWEVLRESVLRPPVPQRETGEAIRAWVTPCASGEKAYSLAMLLDEEAARAGKAFDVKIIATDTADEVLARAPEYIRAESKGTCLRSAWSDSLTPTSTGTASSASCGSRSCSPRRMCCAIRRSRGWMS